MNRRAQRDALIKHKLQQGYAVMFRSTGASLSPMIMSGDCCLFHPVSNAYKCIKQHDVVYCSVTSQDGRRQIFAHMVLGSSYEWWYDNQNHKKHMKRLFTIGNNKGHVNGTAWDHEIFGRLVEVIE